MSFALYPLPVGAGLVALSPLPGRSGAYAADLAVVLAWGPAAVLSMTTTKEHESKGAASLGADLAKAGVAWHHMPVADFGAPDFTQTDRWPDISQALRGRLTNGERVLVHCHGGCGRSGMAAVRLMVEMGESGPQALRRLRDVRPCAIETQAQMDWAFLR